MLENHFLNSYLSVFHPKRRQPVNKAKSISKKQFFKAI